MSDGATVYMKLVPADPLSSQSYTYELDGTDNFVLSALLENPGDESAAESQTRCGVVTPEDLVYMVCAD